MGSMMRYLCLFCLFFVGCTSNQKSSTESDCEDFDTLFDDSSFHLRTYQNMVYIELLNETDSVKIKKLRVSSLRKLFALRDYTVRELHKYKGEFDFTKHYNEFTEDCSRLVPVEQRDRFLKYSKRMYEVQHKSSRYGASFVQLAVYLSIEEAIQINLEDINT